MSIRLKPPNVETHQKNTKLKRKTVKLEQKIEIFEEFMKTGEKLVGNTIFKGYPIGRWAIQIRSSLNRMNDGEGDKVKINLTKEQLEKLESMGILERQFDSTIDEKIDSLVEWRRKYPKIKITPIATDEELREYARTEEEFSRIQEEYKKMQKYYNYARYRKYHGQLNEEQIQRGKEGGIGGVFGYPTRIEELAKKYGIKEKDIDYLLTKFGTLDNFYEMHKTWKITDKKDRTLEGEVIRNVVDIDDNSNMGYDNLYRDIVNDNALLFYSSKRLQEALETIGEREKNVIESIYGLKEGTTHTTIENVGRELGIGRGAVFLAKTKAFARLRHPGRFRKYRIAFEFESLTDKERQLIEKIEKDIQLQNGNLYENLGKLEGFKERLYKEQKERLDKLYKKEEEKEKERKERLERFKKEEERLDIQDVGFSVRTYNSLKRTGIDYVGDLTNVTEEQLREVRGFGKKSFKEVVAKMQDFGISFKTKEQLEKERIEQQELSEEREKRLDIQDVGFSVRTYNSLKKVGINYVGDLANVTEERIREARGFGKKSFKEVVAKMQDFGISFKTKEQLEKERIEQQEERQQELSEEREKIDDIRVEIEEDTTGTASENKVKTERQVAVNEGQKNKDIEKSRLIQRLLEQQQIIDAQKAELYRLSKLLEKPQK